MKNTKNISRVKLKDGLKIIIVLVIVIVLLILFPNARKNYIKESKLFINEIMVKNTYTLKDDNGEYNDYIELYNGYKDSINLLGYHISDSEFDLDKWTFPDISIKPGEYLIIYASGKDICDKEKRICHTSFKLSSKGEVLLLTDDSGNILNKFDYPEMSNDISYGFIDDKYTLLDKPTPGKKNSIEFLYSKLTSKDIYINEYMTHNKNVSYTSSGNYNDFIELYNNSDKDLELHNIYLSDDKNNLIKYKLPDVVVNKNNYLVVSLSDISTFINDEIIANFKLSDGDDIILSNGKEIIEEIEVNELIDNISYGRIDDKWYYFTSPTPGSKNDTRRYEKIGDIE